MLDQLMLSACSFRNIDLGELPSLQPPLKKELVAGPTVAYRLWRVRKFRSGYRLGAVGYAAWIEPGRPRAAECKSALQLARHAAPDPHCSCGWYGVNDVSRVTGYDPNPEDAMIVEGQVALWGRVIEHEYGYRAQYAYPVRIWRREEPVPLPSGFPVIAGDEVLARVAATYGIVAGRL